MELETSKINFKILYRIMKIDLNKVTFRKYKINRNMSINPGIETVQLGEVEGEETYEVIPEVNDVLAGKVGEVIKEFKGKIYGKKTKKFKVYEIVEIEK